MPLWCILGNISVLGGYFVDMSGIKGLFRDAVEWLVDFKNMLIQFFKFQLVSVIAYWVDFGVYSIIYTLLFPGNYWAAKPISYIIGLLTSYLLNKYWTFGIKHYFFSGYLLKFSIVSVIALMANLFAIFILTEFYAVDGYLSAMAATLFSFIINYSGNKVWVFMNEGKI